VSDQTTLYVEQRALDGRVPTSNPRKRSLRSTIEPRPQVFPRRRLFSPSRQRPAQCGRADDDAVGPETDGRARRLAIRPGFAGSSDARDPVNPGTACSMT
jgi:hypothetical protein